MVQHLLLVVVAAPLLALGDPAAALAASAPATVRRRLARWSRPIRSIPRRHATPLAVAAWLAHVSVLWAWHAPALYTAALTHPAIHALEHGSLLATGWLFWVVVMTTPRRPPLGVGGSLVYLFAAAGQGTVLGAVLTFAATPWYAAHAASAAAWGLTPLEDQQLAGLLMWIPAGTVYLVVALALMARTLGARAAVGHRP
jgi:cytochrome c oxidase assembly factor CtaG